jgi:hypothetical protein
MKSILITLFFLPFGLSAQIGLGGNDPDQLAHEIVGWDIGISNIQYTGWVDAISFFQADVENMPFQTGILLTNGSRYVVPGPNDSIRASVENGLPGDTLVEWMLNHYGGDSRLSYDATVLEFDAITYGDTLRFNYIFGSDEYGYEFSNNYNDMFAILISGPGINGLENIARFPNNVQVTYNNFYPSVLIDNGNGTLSPNNSSTSYLRYDKLSIPLIAKRKVIPGQTYHVKLLIADVGDDGVDSGVFIKTKGMTTKVDDNALETSFDIYPNPVTDQFSISLKEGSLLESYELVDVSGKCLTKGELGSLTQVDFSGMASGMYHLRLIAKTGSITKKLVKY